MTTLQVLCRKVYLLPEFLIEGAGNDASLKQYDDSFVCSVLNLKVQVFFPVLQLGLLKGLYVEIGPADLKMAGFALYYVP